MDNAQSLPPTKKERVLVFFLFLLFFFPAHRASRSTDYVDNMSAGPLEPWGEDRPSGFADNGGDPLAEDLNVFYSVWFYQPHQDGETRLSPARNRKMANIRFFSYQTGDFAWVMTCSALVLLMIPGVGFFYSGLARRKSALALILLSLMSVAIVGFQWFFWGYSLAFSHTSSSAFIGDLSNFGLMKVLAQPFVPDGKLPDILFCLYQGMFAAIT